MFQDAQIPRKLSQFKEAIFLLFFFPIKSRVFASISGIIRASLVASAFHSRTQARNLQHRSTMLHLPMIPT